MSSCSSINCKKMNSEKNIPAQERWRVGHCENGDWNCNEKSTDVRFLLQIWGLLGDALLLFYT